MRRSGTTTSATASPTCSPRRRERGVTGVPTFAYDGHAARGAVPPEQLERLVGDV